MQAQLIASDRTIHWQKHGKHLWLKVGGGSRGAQPLVAIPLYTGTKTRTKLKSYVVQFESFEPSKPWHTTSGPVNQSSYLSLTSGRRIPIVFK